MREPIERRGREAGIDIEFGRASTNSMCHYWLLWLGSSSEMVFLIGLARLLDNKSERCRPFICRFDIEVSKHRSLEA